MFVVTMTRKTMKRVIIATCALLLVCTTAIGGVLLFGDGATTAMASQDSSEMITNIEDVAKYFEKYGITADITTGEVSTVLVPKKFDDDFEEFNELIKEGGGDLDDMKDRSVERWRILSTNRTFGNELIWAVMLVHNNRSVGCYLMSEPSGQVFAVTDIENIVATELETAQLISIEAE